MNWLDEGALYSSIGLFLREDLGRGDITTQSVLMRNARARGRFVAGEKMVVAGLEAAEEVFITLDPQQQLEAFAADGEEVEAGKVIARTSGFADVLLAGERTALNLLQHLSGIATITRQFVGSSLITIGLLLAVPTTAVAQQTTGVPGSPDATTTIDGRYLPPPPHQVRAGILFVPGAVEEGKDDPRVVASYLGSSGDAINRSGDGNGRRPAPRQKKRAQQRKVPSATP